MKKILFFLISIFIITGCSNNKEDGIKIIATNFPSYDLTRAIVKDSNINLSMLLKPGTEIHDYEPTPKDIKNISDCDIFIYVGGESDEWIDDIIDNIDLNKTKIIKLMDLVDVLEEEVKDGMKTDSEETEYDEHIWTSPKNAIKIINGIYEEIIKIDLDNKDLYENNKNDYINKLEEIDLEIRNLVNNSKRKEIIFGDRFPLRYFVDEYGLDYYAAFLGCAHETEASAKTLTFLINKVKSDNIPVVFHLELSNGNIARTISESTGAKVLEFNSIHNVTTKQLEDGVTYIDLMKKNIEVLSEALN